MMSHFFTFSLVRVPHGHLHQASDVLLNFETSYQPPFILGGFLVISI